MVAFSFFLNFFMYNLQLIFLKMKAHYIIPLMDHGALTHFFDVIFVLSLTKFIVHVTEDNYGSRNFFQFFFFFYIKQFCLVKVYNYNKIRTRTSGEDIKNIL